MVSYNENLMGAMTITQKTNQYTIQIRQGNCLAVFIHESKEYVTLYSFFADEQHLKNIIKADKKPFWDEVTNIRLNLRYKECNTLLKYFVRSGYEVSCYYE